MSLGDRMKEYEHDLSPSLDPALFTILRLDGRAFHSYTKSFDRPFDHKLITLMNETAVYLCSQITGAQLGFVQSDEITIALKRSSLNDMFYRGKVVKIVSIAASMASAFFNRHPLALPDKLALFDARIFQVPTLEEVINNFIWRQDDCCKNSIAMIAQSLYPHAQLQGKNQKEQQELARVKGSPWEMYDAQMKWGRIIVREAYDKTVSLYNDPSREITVIRHRWVARSCVLWREQPCELRSYLEETK